MCSLSFIGFAILEKNGISRVKVLSLMAMMVILDASSQ